MIDPGHGKEPTMRFRHRGLAVILAAAACLVSGCSRQPHAIAIQSEPGSVAQARRALVRCDPTGFDAFTRDVLTVPICADGARADTVAFLPAFTRALDHEFARVDVPARIYGAADPPDPADLAVDLVLLLENVVAYGFEERNVQAPGRVYRVLSVEFEARVPPAEPGGRAPWWAYLQAQLGDDTMESLAGQMAATLVAQMVADGVIAPGPAAATEPGAGPAKE
jgi:hypothetical protein